MKFFTTAVSHSSNYDNSGDLSISGQKQAYWQISVAFILCSTIYGDFILK